MSTNTDPQPCPTCGDQPDAPGRAPSEHYVWCHEYVAPPAVDLGAVATAIGLVAPLAAAATPETPPAAKAPVVEPPKPVVIVAELKTE